MLHLKRIKTKFVPLTSVTATLGTEESGLGGEVAVMGRWGCNMTFFCGVQHVFLDQHPTLVIQS